jgi:hypothetical protein
MPELSNLIRQRLGAANAPATHPDADLISSYAEGGLQPNERAEMVRHMATCADCRELLALSLPEQAVTSAPEMAPSRRSRFSGSYLRIAASLAMVVVVALLILKRPHQRQVPQTQAVPSEMARSAPPSAPPVANEAAAPNTGSVPKLTASTEERVENAPVRRAARIREDEQAQAVRVSSSALRPSARQVQVANAAVSQDYINSQVLANQLFLADQAQQRASLQELPAAPAPAFARPQKNMFLAGGLPANGDFSGVPRGSYQQKSESVSTVSIFHDSSRHGLSIGSTIARVGSELHLKRPLAQITSQNANNYAMFKPSPGTAGAEIASKAETSETLKQSPAFTGLALAAPTRSQSPMFLWRIMQGRLLKSSDMNNWVEGYPASEGVEFTVIRSAGPEVWAGGSNAALVHSTDSGASWRRIVLGAAATGAITGIEVSGNGKNIQVTSSSGQSWASRDGGNTWTSVN